MASRVPGGTRITACFAWLIAGARATKGEQAGCPRLDSRGRLSPDEQRRSQPFPHGPGREGRARTPWDDS